MHYDKIILDEKRNVSLTVMIQDVGGEFQKLKKRPAVLILPGGGYAMCSDREAEPVAFAYAKAGYQAFILRYSVKEHSTWPNPLNDYEMAMEMIRSKTEEWHVYEDKIAVIGFSAGGHLAGCAATMSKNRPNAAILGYAALSKEFWESFKPGIPSPVLEVDDKTCPCFLFAARDDVLVPVSETV
ncbi:MAG TPA: alpha/beta hydrolase, partial [Clostridiaceae bacterium]|nr:alpha/beta hydrolase [Clostridiaceae bacterium]